MFDRIAKFPQSQKQDSGSQSPDDFTLSSSSIFAQAANRAWLWAASADTRSRAAPPGTRAGAGGASSATSVRLTRRYEWRALLSAHRRCGRQRLGQLRPHDAADVR